MLALHACGKKPGAMAGAMANARRAVVLTADASSEAQSAVIAPRDGHLIGGHRLLCLAMPLRKALAASQFDRPGWSKPVTRDEATSAVYGLSGHECGDIDRTLKHVLWPYWEDATPPVHVPKEFPPDMDPSERARSHQSGAVAYSGRLSRSTPTIGLF
jgi:hypothetical protein